MRRPRYVRECEGCGKRIQAAGHLCRGCLDARAEARQPNPSGLCQCGCGERAPLARSWCEGNVKGRPLRFIRGHHLRKASVEYLVDENTGCWVWQLGKTAGGYGETKVDGRGLLAHRHYYEQTKGPIPAGLVLDHLCRNPSCVNPDHLEAVTHAENVRRGASTKLSNDDVRAIRASEESDAALAIRYGISRTYLKDVRSGRRRKAAA